MRGGRPCVETSGAELTEFAPEGTVPTPDQWIAYWNTLSLEKRQLRAFQIIDNAQIASDCFIENHRSHLQHLLNCVAELEAQLEQARTFAATVEAQNAAALALHRVDSSGEWCVECIDMTFYPCVTVRALRGETT